MAPTQSWPKMVNQVKPMSFVELQCILKKYLFVYQPLVLPGSASNHDLDLDITYTVLENMAKCTRINITNYNKEHQSQLYGVAPLVQYPP